MAQRRFTKPDSEAIVHERIVRFLKRDHPEVVFKTDFSAGLKLPIWLAARQRKLQWARGFPDLFIYKPMFHDPDSDKELVRRLMYCGLAIEIKRPGTRLKKQDGNWASDHLAEQANVLQLLEERGYAAAFARGYDEAVDIIEGYLSGQFMSLSWQDLALKDHDAPKLTHEQEVF